MCNQSAIKHFLIMFEIYFPLLLNSLNYPVISMGFSDWHECFCVNIVRKCSAEIDN